MKKVLVNFAHPAKFRSNINIALREAIEDLPGVTVNDLYANYPDFMIDVKREQNLCESHDFIVFQHPFYWYSTPAIIKEWLDLVLEHGWAFGSSGKALEGKYVFHALSAGGDSESYHERGFNRFTINELLSPFIATANLCNLTWLPPFAILGAHRGLESEVVVSHAENYRRILIALRDSQFDFSGLDSEEFINTNINQRIRNP